MHRTLPRSSIGPLEGHGGVDEVGLSVVLQFYAGGGTLQPYTIDIHAGDAATDVARVFDLDPEGGVAAPEGERVALPAPRHAGLEQQPVAPQPDAEHPFDDRAVQPAGRTGVPGPAAAADVRRDRIDIRAFDVGFDLVARGL